MKNFLLLFATIFSVSVFAQQDQNLDCNNSSKIIKNDFQSDKSAVVIWSEDFGGGFPSSWGTYTSNTGAGNSGTSAGNTAEAPWKHSMVGSWGYWNSVGTSGGNPTGPAAAINSTTAANGFLISDIDSANHWNGNPGSNSGSTYHFIESYFTTSAIDLSGFPNVSLEFEHSFRLNNSVVLTVSISTDSTNWTTYNVQGNATNNQASADPEYLSLNISPIAGNSSTVYVKVGWNARVYFWMLDDMKIIETPDDRIDLTEITHGGWYTTPTTNGFGLDYTIVPMKQAIANPYTFEGIVANLGALSQTTHINVEVYNGSGNNVFSTTSADSVLNPQDTIIFVGQNKFTPTTEDEYYFETWASSIDTVSDTMYSSSIVSEKVYARDNGTDHSEYGLGRSCGGMIIGTYFDVYDTDDLASLSVFMKDNSVVGADIYAVLYEIDASNGKIYLTQSDDYSLTSNDLGNWVTIPLDDDFTLVPGTYMAAVGSYANPIDTSVLAMSQYTEAATCYIQKNGCLSTGQTFGSWYWTSRVPMVRMNFATISAIEENIFDGEVSIYPNPSSDFIRIDMIDVNKSEYNVSIINVLGEKVFDVSESISGNYMKQIDVRNLANGTYILQIKNEETIFVEKIIIE
ncbi:MAG: T9SS type A sorting domain-containing protein [Flavobacteriales bacterium]|nr:T9SS type A sorting domain-containing protein [Flavobacteriales bacterium]